jgi:hypothetical protein
MLMRAVMLIKSNSLKWIREKGNAFSMAGRLWRIQPEFVTPDTVIRYTDRPAIYAAKFLLRKKRLAILWRYRQPGGAVHETFLSALCRCQIPLGIQCHSCSRGDGARRLGRGRVRWQMAA